MYLKKVDIHGFKGISHLTLDLHQYSNVLIGENRWGRSSLISSLMLISFENQDYQFVESDFYRGNDVCDHLYIDFIYAHSNEQDFSFESYQKLSDVEYYVDSQKLICYRIEAYKQKDIIKTDRFFVDQYGDRIVVDNANELAKLLIQLNPIMNLKNPIVAENAPVTNQPLSDYYVKELSEKLSQYSEQFSDEDLARSLVAIQSLLDYYFVDKDRRYHYKHVEKKETASAQDWNSVEKINRQLDEVDNQYIRTALLGMFSAILIAKGNNTLLPMSIPILILEEPETNLHPISLSVGFRLLNNIPVQKIITTNSSDLISLFPLESIYRLIRRPDRILAMNVYQKMNQEDARRILFHIFYRRSTALFARCWLLVEGETEVWLLRELAEQSGYHFGSEGIQVIEFAQCGLKPLIKYANQMGIVWHVLTDGDVAGRKYADSVRSLCNDLNNIDNYLTVLPAKDMENFLFKNGFSHIYKLAAYNTTEHLDIPVPRIIKKAIHRKSKPDLAIAVCDEAKDKGVEAIPRLFRRTFSRIIHLTKRRYMFD